MKTRILHFIKVENKSAAQLADDIGVQPSSISHIISGRNNPSLDFVMKMLTKYPYISSDWLLFGKGDMYRDPQMTGLFGRNSEDNAPELNQGDDSQDRNIRNISDEDDEKSAISDEKKLYNGKSKAIRIVSFYSDNTFREFFSADEMDP